MDRSSEIREFLRTRRARITPEQAGIAPHAGPRRVPGLRREEVAQLAGVSVDYYIRLERGRTQGVSEAVLDAVARALHLDDPNAPTSATLPIPPPLPGPAASDPSPRNESAPPSTGPWTHSASPPSSRAGAWMAANPLGYALFADFASRPHHDRNFARFVFLDQAALSLSTDWERVAGDTVASLRLYAGRHADDPQLTELIGELSLHSDTFRRLWADHDVRAHATGTKRLHHPLVGDLTLDYVVLAAEDDPEQSLAIYTPEPASPSAEALGILASWTSTSTTAAPEQTHNPPN
ncbi:helix-turn-helix domain-containing protein [Streptomyces goshikiensis]|uniref:helix-turn-helix domain-containing protein n=1 Tax=Streptomyces goshikiensis TaxID=1942 RepID=UPI00371BC840